MFSNITTPKVLVLAALTVCMLVLGWSIYGHRAIALSKAAPAAAVPATDAASTGSPKRSPGPGTRELPVESWPMH